MTKQLIGVVGLILIGTFIAFTFPTIVDSVPGETERTVSLAEGDSEIVTDYLRVSVVESSNADVEVTATNTRTGDTETHIIDEGTTQTYTLGGDTVDVTNQVSTNELATLTVQYGRSFGWSDSSDWFIDNLGLLMIVLAFVTIMSGFVVVVRS